MAFRKDSFFTQLQNDMTAWVGALAKPFIPPRAVPYGDHGLLLEFWDKKPETVMLGKLVRAVSGMNAAIELAEMGYVTECGALLRIVSDFCEEIATIAVALQGVHDGKPMNPEVKAFISHYFLPMAKSPDEFAAQEKVRYVSRERLLIEKVKMSPLIPGIGSDMILKLARFVNRTYDGYVHGYVESTMDLWDPQTQQFEVTGRSDKNVKGEFVEAALMKFHELVVAIELTASMTGNVRVFESARTARGKMDELGISVDPSKR